MEDLSNHGSKTNKIPKWTGFFSRFLRKRNIVNSSPQIIELFSLDVDNCLILQGKNGNNIYSPVYRKIVAKMKELDKKGHILLPLFNSAMVAHNLLSELEPIKNGEKIHRFSLLKDLRNQFKKIHSANPIYMRTLFDPYEPEPGVWPNSGYFESFYAPCYKLAEDIAGAKEAETKSNLEKELSLLLAQTAAMEALYDAVDWITNCRIGEQSDNFFILAFQKLDHGARNIENLLERLLNEADNKTSKHLGEQLESFQRLGKIIANCRAKMPDAAFKPPEAKIIETIKQNLSGTGNARPFIEAFVDLAYQLLQVYKPGGKSEDIFEAYSEFLEKNKDKQLIKPIHKIYQELRYIKCGKTDKFIMLYSSGIRAMSKGKKEIVFHHTDDKPNCLHDTILACDALNRFFEPSKFDFVYRLHYTLGQANPQSFEQDVSVPRLQELLKAKTFALSVVKAQPLEYLELQKQTLKH